MLFRKATLADHALQRPNRDIIAELMRCHDHDLHSGTNGSLPYLMAGPILKVHLEAGGAPDFDEFSVGTAQAGQDTINCSSPRPVLRLRNAKIAA